MAGRLPSRVARVAALAAPYDGRPAQLGIVGSFVGGFLGFLIFGADPQGGFLQPSGIIGSIIGAIIVLGIYVAVTRRRHVTR